MNVTAAAVGWVARLNAFIDRTGDVRALTPLRIAAGPIVMAHLRQFLDLAGQGIVYSDRFYQPFFSWYPEAPRGLYLLMLYATVGTAVATSIGLFTRAATSWTAFFVAYNVFLSKTHFHHNRAFLIILLTGLALLPVGRHLSVDAVLRRRLGSATRAGALLWPLWAMRFEVAAVYAASGMSKLVDPDWFGGTVTRIRVERVAGLVLERGVPQWMLEILLRPGFHVWFAKVVVLTEVFIAFGLLWRRTRLGAVWVAIPFHVSIQLVADVQVFSYAGLAALVIWATPAARDRTVIVRGRSTAARVLGWACRWLDWLGRFEVVRDPGDGPALTLVDRPGPDGAPVVRHGAPAARMILSRLPLTFWFAAPALLPGLREAWDRGAARRLAPSEPGPDPGGGEGDDQQAEHHLGPADRLDR